MTAYSRDLLIQLEQDDMIKRLGSSHLVLLDHPVGVSESNSCEVELMRGNYDNLCGGLSVSHPELVFQTTIDPTMRQRRKGELSQRVLNHLVRQKEFHSESEVDEFLQKAIEEIHESDTLTGRLSSSPQDRAFEKIFQAWNAPQEEKVNLAREALSISPECVDAYILLAEEEATSDEERCALYLEAVRVGERELGPESFEYNRGMFWQIVETRPYMRAKAGLAQSLIEVGDESGAIQQYKDILSLNPGDNQAVRYPLIDLLLLKKDEPNYLAYLFERYQMIA